MKKTVVIVLLLLVTALLILAGFHFEKDVLSSIGYVILIFYIIMAVRTKFVTSEKKSR